MTDIRRALNEPRIHQSHVTREAQRSCDTPELLTCTNNNAPKTPSSMTSATRLSNGHSTSAFSNQGNQVSFAQPNYRKPLLQTLADHMHMSSASGGSTTSNTVTAAAAAATASATIGRSNGATNGGNSVNYSEIQFDEREIFYVSPSKRKPSFSATATQSSQRSLKAATACIASTQGGVVPASSAYTTQHEYSFDSGDVASRYSDTALQLLRSGTATAASNNLNACSSSSNSSLTPQALPLRTQNNVVTFSSPVVPDMTPTLTSAASAAATQSQHRGSLRRSKGRSQQSLCSCDAGAETEINPDPTRPLFQYSLERRHKGHTYTCEQNAQILMRLERERHRKFSLGGGEGGLIKDEFQNDTHSSSDVDAAIPPIPPPPTLKRNASMRSLLRQQHQQQHMQQQQTRPSSSICGASNSNNNNTINSIATLCSSDMLKDCANNALKVGSVIDDCTTSILRCANAVGAELMAATSISGAQQQQQQKQLQQHQRKASVATLATMASLSKPDVCHVTTPYNSYCLRADDIFAPSTKQSDPALCFVHLGGGGGGIGFNEEPPPSALPRSKYNTIGPSSDYARQLASYGLQQQWAAQQQKQQQQQQLSQCRCLSQSLSNFSRDYFGHSGHKGPNRELLPMQRIYYTSSHHDDQHHAAQYTKHHKDDAAADWLCEPPPPPPIISRSYGDLLNIGGSQLAFEKFHSNNIGSDNIISSSNNNSCSNIIGNSNITNNLLNSSFTTLTSASSGLKEKLHQQQKPQHQQHHQQHHHHLQHQQLSAQQQKQQQPQLHASVSSFMPWKHRQCPSRGSSSSGTNSFRFDAAKHWLAVSSILLIIGAASVAVPLALRVAASAPFEERLRVAVQLLDQVPLIDGHNDLPWNIRKFLHNKLNDFNFDEDLRNVMPWARSHWSHTDLTRLKKGRISAQFWAAYVPCEAQHRDAVQLTLEQIDVIKRLTDRYAPQLTTCTSAEEIIEAHKNHQLCSLTGVEGGHSLGGSLAVLRTLYAIGVRYMTLTSTCHTPWADSSYADAPTFNVKHGGLTIFGKTIIREMNRLGMMVDLSHVSTGTMRDALEVSEAPVIFSHSSAYEVCNSSRNVQDDMLQSLAKNGGLVMVNFYSKFLSCSDNSTVHDAVAHINHIKRIAGIDHVGLGAGFDGINFTPKGLEDVSSYPTLFAELLGVGWSIEDLTKLAGGNFLRVMQQVEKLRDEKKAAGVKPYEDHPNFRTDDPYNCTSS